MQGEYTIKEIRNVIFQYKDIANKKEKEELIRVLQHEILLLKDEVREL